MDVIFRKEDDVNGGVGALCLTEQGTNVRCGSGEFAGRGHVEELGLRCGDNDAACCFVEAS